MFTKINSLQPFPVQPDYQLNDVVKQVISPGSFEPPQATSHIFLPIHLHQYVEIWFHEDSWCRPQKCHSRNDANFVVIQVNPAATDALVSSTPKHLRLQGWLKLIPNLQTPNYNYPWVILNEGEHFCASSKWVVTILQFPIHILCVWTKFIWQIRRLKTNQSSLPKKSFLSS